MAGWARGGGVAEVLKMDFSHMIVVQMGRKPKMMRFTTKGTKETKKAAPNDKRDTNCTNLCEFFDRGCELFL